MANPINYKFLVVDDHFLIRQMVSKTLKDNGYPTVEAAVDGADALTKIKAATDGGAPFEIVFLDWSMPNVKGLDVLKLCRADRKLDNMAIIMLTAESEDMNIVAALQAGATAYVTKPFKPETLLKKIEDVATWRQKKQA